ncbi:hypothetical protein D3C78_1771470 [compost metagenome]
MFDRLGAGEGQPAADHEAGHPLTGGPHGDTEEGTAIPMQAAHQRLQRETGLVGELQQGAAVPQIAPLLEVAGEQPLQQGLLLGRRA